MVAFFPWINSLKVSRKRQPLWKYPREAVPAPKHPHAIWEAVAITRGEEKTRKANARVHKALWGQLPLFWGSECDELL